MEVGSWPGVDVHSEDRRGRLERSKDKGPGICALLGSCKAAPAYCVALQVKAIESGTFSMTILTVVTIERLSLHQYTQAGTGTTQ
eukprot:1596707-Rhodomonas_salina.4